jgi:hypothetical protein
MAVAILGKAILGKMILGYTGDNIWFEPKTNWAKTDRFNIDDFDRIKGNIQWLHSNAARLNKDFVIHSMGNNEEDYLSYWKVEDFNAFEKNIELINSFMYPSDIGITQNFFENGPFIKWEELNRIESSCLKMKGILDRQEAGLKRLSFRLGSMKGVRI